MNNLTLFMAYAQARNRMQDAALFRHGGTFGIAISDDAYARDYQKARRVADKMPRLRPSPWIP